MRNIGEQGNLVVEILIWVDVLKARVNRRMTHEQRARCMHRDAGRAGGREAAASPVGLQAEQGRHWAALDGNEPIPLQELRLQ